jgi:MarR family transcriptional regulator, transcriptional regulator for hemolysin
MQIGDVVAPESFVSLAQLINRASRGLARAGDAALRPLGFRHAQVPVFALLRDDNESTQTALAAATGIEQGSMAQLLARMERDGLIRRTRNRHDGRSQLIRLTSEANERLDEARDLLAETEANAVSGFTGKELATLANLLSRLCDNLKEAPPKQAAR